MTDDAPTTETRACSKCGQPHTRRSSTRWYSYCLDCHRDAMRDIREASRRSTETEAADD